MVHYLAFWAMKLLITKCFFLDRSEGVKCPVLPLFTLMVSVVFDMVGALLVTFSIVSVEVDPKREIELTQKMAGAPTYPLALILLF